jgi:SPP1 family predicted phage head-tail adaptor
MATANKIVRAGELKHKVRIEKRETTQDGFGGVIVTWAEQETVQAAIEPLQGTEFFDAGTINERQPAWFRMRYTSGLDTDMRMVDVETGDVYEIITIINYHRANVLLEILGAQLNDEST